MDEAQRSSGRLTFGLVALAFLGTPLLAGLWYAYGDAGHGARLNHGTLIDPPRPVAGAKALGLEDYWTLVVYAPERCAQPCAEMLLMLRQVRLTFGQDSELLARVLVSGQADADRAALAAAHPDLRVITARDARALLDAIGPMVPGQSALVDPLGNAMLSYAPGTPPADVKADLKRLLKNSRSWLR